MEREQFILSALLHRVTQLYGQNLNGYKPITDEKLNYILETAEKWALAERKPETNIPKTLLKPVLEQVNRESGYTASYFFEPKKLELHKNFFPKKIINHTADYRNLLKDLNNDLNNLLTEDTSILIENCYNLLHKYTVTIPFHSALPDVPLFDHCKTLAALTVCIYDYLNEKNKPKLANTDEPILFIGGSISGIQNYIYDIVSQFAGKNLKGRSFYLQLLIDSVIEKILQELNLFHTNIVYASGGGFYMLAPNTQFVQQKIQDFEKLISDKLFELFKLGLTINIESIVLTENDLMKGEINEKWGELADKINQKKRKKHANRFSSDYSYFFETAEQGGKLKKDAITNEEITDEDFEKGNVFAITENGISEYPTKNSKSDGKYILRLTKQQIDLGQNLRETEFIIKTTQEIPEWKEKALHCQNPLDLGIYWYFFDNLPSQTNKKTTLIQMNNPERFLQVSWGNKSKIIYDFTFYGGNKIPKKKSRDTSKSAFEPKNFNDLAGEEEDNFKRLAILRMDVDNLGKAFKEGLGKQNLTFSKYSTLSRSLDYFFKGYINTIRKENQNFKDWIYIVYAGGDDLFVVGKWDELIKFAEAIKQEFKQWVCENPTLTLSAGVAIVTAKFPLLKAAHLSGEAEDAAKKHVSNTQEKNAVCLLDIPLNWDNEFPKVKKLKEELVEKVNSELLHRGFLQKIQTLYQMCVEQRKHKQNESWQWILAYDFARAKERKKNDEDFKKYLTDLQKQILTNNVKNTHYSYLELLNVAARWAELETKNEKN